VEPYVIAFGHHSNKNVEMVLEAWRDLIAAGVVTASTPRLNIVGLTEQSRTELDGLVGDLGIRAHVVLSPYLADDDFHALMVGCAVVLFPSDFEGFGLPVVEGMQLGKPVVVGPDEAIRAALSESPEAIAAARDYAASFTWARAARQTREFLLTLG
jgi:glycosyltransferase involved in cell wall biosynthesis